MAVIISFVVMPRYLTKELFMKHSLLDKVFNTIKQYYNLPDRDVRKVLRFALGCWAIQSLSQAPYLLIQAPSYGHGKSRLMDITSWLCPNGEDPISIVMPSEASIYSQIEVCKIEKRVPCLFLDELGQLYNGKRDNSMMTAIMDAGFERGRTVSRVSIVKGKRHVERLETFGPKCFTSSKDKGQGQFPDSFLSRTDIINLLKRKTIRYNKLKAQKIFNELGKELAAFVAERIHLIEHIDASVLVPAIIEGRDYDKWENSFIVSRLADIQDVTDITAVTDVTRIGAWQRLCTEDALSEIEDKKDETPEIEAVSLLRDMISVIVDDGNYDLINNTKIPTEYFVPRDPAQTGYKGILGLSESKWASYSYGRPLTQKEFADILQEVLLIKRPNMEGTIRTGRGPKDVAKGWDMRLMYEQIKLYCPDLYELYIKPHIGPEKPVTSGTSGTTVTNTTEKEDMSYDEYMTAKHGIDFSKPPHNDPVLVELRKTKKAGESITLEEYQEARKQKSA